MFREIYNKLYIECIIVFPTRFFFLLYFVDIRHRMCFDSKETTQVFAGIFSNADKIWSRQEHEFQYFMFVYQQ